MTRTIKIGLAGLGLAAAACGGPQPLEEARHPTGSAAMAASSSFQALYVANAAEDSVTRVPTSGQPLEVGLAGEPTRVARAGDRVFVTLRAERKLAVMKDETSGLRLERTIDVGHEPFGVVASEDGATVYVSSSLSGRVDEIDAQSLSVLRSWTVADEPRWLALHPGGHLYVGSAWKGTLTWIDLGSGKVHELRMPDRNTFEQETGDEVPMSARITGDLSVSPDGQYLVVPALYLDSQNPIAEPQEGSGEVVQSSSGGYSPDRFNPVVAIVPINGSGKPKLGDADLVTVTSFNDMEPVVGYPASATVDPNSELVYVTVEGASAVIAFHLAAHTDGGGLFDNLFDDVGFSQFEFREHQVIGTSAGPRGVAFTSAEDGFVYGFLDRTVQTFDAAEISGRLVGNGENERRARFGEALFARDGRLVSAGQLPPEAEAGRRLFYSTRDSRMSQQGSGVSCATCHFDGRTDGLTWTFDSGSRQTPSLAGRVSLTEPVRWAGDRATVIDDARVTSQGLMGGDGIQDQDLIDVAAFIDYTRDVDSPNRGRDDPAVSRGEAIFNRSDVGCASCHNGARMTDNRNYSMFGMRTVQTRSLVGLAGSPPYLHDGSAPTIMDLLVRLRAGEMGDTSSLSDAQMSDLEAYLLSL